MKLGIIRCMQTEDYCPGSRDFRTIRERKGAFMEQRYPSMFFLLQRSSFGIMLRILFQKFTIVAVVAWVNTSTLKEIFKAVYGQPIATYMKEFRVRQAMKLLRETNDTIADIASQVGYQTQGKFSSAFQFIVKMSPREYRKIQSIAPSDSFSKTL